jgi:hypothetical protein
VTFDSAAMRALAQTSDVQQAMDLVSRVALQAMKKNTPVSPVGPLHRSGNLRSSERIIKQPNGDTIIGPTASYGAYVNDGTPPHIIRSTGPWPLRNPETGQVFGRVVHHPGTKPARFIEAAAREIDGMQIRI